MLQVLNLTLDQGGSFSFVYIRTTPLASEALWIAKNTNCSSFLLGDLNLNPNEPPQMRRFISEEKKLYLGIYNKIWSVQPASVALCHWHSWHSLRLIDWSIIVVLYTIPIPNSQFPIPNCGRVDIHWDSSTGHCCVVRPTAPASPQTLVQRWKAAAKKKERAMNDRIKVIFMPPRDFYATRMNDQIKVIF